FDEEDWRTALALDLDVAVQGPEQAERLLMLQGERALNVWLKLDSGMHRLGFTPDEIRRWAERLRAAPQVAAVSLLSPLACADEEDWRTALALDLDVAVQGPEQAERLLMLQGERALNVWLKLDSGMHRLGFTPDEIRRWAERLRAAPQVAEVNLLSHLACAD